VFAIELWRSASAQGNIPLVVGGREIARISAAALDGLERRSFTDAEEGKEQSGYLLRDVLLRYLDEDELRPDAVISVGSSARKKSAEVTWASAVDPAQFVMLAVSNRGTLKLVSLLPGLDSRDRWVQDVDRIEVKP
jgi:hypothetical protein